MFDINIPEKNTRIMESEYVIPGERIVPPVDTPIGKLGLAIVSFNCGLVCVCVCVSQLPFRPILCFSGVLNVWDRCEYYRARVYLLVAHLTACV